MDNHSKIDYKNIGQRIKNARDAKRLTQGQLAQSLATPLTATAISLYESGERDINLSVLTEIAHLLDVPLEFLIKGSNNAPSINVALRADKTLQNNQKAQDQILDFIEYVKEKTKDK